MKLTAVILGATGLVGEHLLQQILEDSHFDKVIVLTRRMMTYKHSKLEYIITDFSDLHSVSKPLKADVLFSCLGTTRSKTPDLNQYRNIEVNIPQSIARQLQSNGLTQIHFISAIGVKSNSNNFYIRIKDEAEKALEAIGAASLYIYRPALITGNRKEFRIMEKAAEIFFKIFNYTLWGPLKKFRSTQAGNIAGKMIRTASQPKTGKHIVYFP